MPKTNQIDLFMEESQGDLLGPAKPAAYVPDLEHVRNRLNALLAEMHASVTWPWADAVVTLHRERTFGYLCGLLPGAERVEWQRRIEAEVARLDASSHVEPDVAAE